MKEYDNQMIETFLEEVIIMRQFNHPNVLSLVGVSVHNNKPCAVLPLMVNGDVRKFLLKNGEVSRVISNIYRKTTIFIEILGVILNWK